MVAVFLLVAFSVPASAESRSDIKLTYRVYGNNKTTLNLDNDDKIGDLGRFIYSYSGDSHSFGGVQNYSYLHQFIAITHEDGEPLFLNGENYHVSFSGIKNTCISSLSYEDIFIRLVYSDGSKTDFFTVPSFDLESHQYIHSISFNVDSEYDVESLFFWIVSPHTPGTSASIGLQNPKIDISKLSLIETVFAKLSSNIKSLIETVSTYIEDNGGLISTIKTVIQNGFNSLLFDISEVRDYVADIFDTIKGIPGNIVNSLVEKFNELFVPSSDDFLALYSDFYAFLDEKMPLITQIITLCQNLSEKFVYSDVLNVITIPEIELPINNETFVFGPYRVPVVPKGFGFLQTACKTISSLVIVFLTVNFMISKIRQFLLEVQE